MVREQKKMVILAMLILLVVIIADQVSKSFARESISYGEKIEVSEVVVLTHATNAGFFMNAGDNLQSDYRYWMVSILPFVIIGWIIYRFSSHLLSGRLSAVGIALLLGGGFGNLCDRIITGGVTDFIYIQMGSFISGIFNVADVAIAFGIFLLTIGKLKTIYEQRSIDEPVLTGFSETNISACMEKS